jgi:hypothetical protein
MIGSVIEPGVYGYRYGPWYISLEIGTAESGCVSVACGCSRESMAVAESHREEESLTVSQLTATVAWRASNALFLAELELYE